MNCQPECKVQTYPNLEKILRLNLQLSCFGAGLNSSGYWIDSPSREVSRALWTTFQVYQTFLLGPRSIFSSRVCRGSYRKRGCLGSSGLQTSSFEERVKAMILQAILHSRGDWRIFGRELDRARSPQTKRPNYPRPDWSHCFCSDTTLPHLALHRLQTCPPWCRWAPGGCPAGRARVPPLVPLCASRNWQFAADWLISHSDSQQIPTARFQADAGGSRRHPLDSSWETLAHLQFVVYHCWLGGASGRVLWWYRSALLQGARHSTYANYRAEAVHADAAIASLRDSSGIGRGCQWITSARSVSPLESRAPGPARWSCRAVAESASWVRTPNSCRAGSRGTRRSCHTWTIFSTTTAAIESRWYPQSTLSSSQRAWASWGERVRCQYSQFSLFGFLEGKAPQDLHYLASSQSSRSYCCTKTVFADCDNSVNSKCLWFDFRPNLRISVL